MLSIIIPSFKEPYLNKTIDNLLANATGEIEIIAVFDGYWPPTMKEDPRVHIIHFGQNKGLRAAINAGIALAKGEYLMKIDAHCTVGKGFDQILTKDLKDNWVVVPRRYKLDVEKWEVMPDQYVDYDKLIIMESRHKFHAQEWISRRKERKGKMVDETMSFQGSCWVMTRKHWDSVIKELQEAGYGRFVQEAVEIGMKTFQSGGKLMVNKNTWYAHKDRKFKRTHNITREEADAGDTYSLGLWMNEYLKLKEYFRL